MSGLHADHVDAATGCEALFWGSARVQNISNRAFALLVETLGVAAVDETLLLSKDPCRVGSTGEFVLGDADGHRCGKMLTG